MLPGASEQGPGAAAVADHDVPGLHGGTGAGAAQDHFSGAKALHDAPPFRRCPALTVAEGMQRQPLVAAVEKQTVDGIEQLQRRGRLGAQGGLLRVGGRVDARPVPAAQQLGLEFAQPRTASGGTGGGHGPIQRQPDRVGAGLFEYLGIEINGVVGIARRGGGKCDSGSLVSACLCGHRDEVFEDLDGGLAAAVMEQDLLAVLDRFLQMIQQPRPVAIVGTLE